ncbi:hypothetical protein AAHA92_10750 [Salvia divinorum]|uniref:Uncharacterized protein n=1 Tax=Salvia divinorum TaxID=28513 RepID=A0ABD1HVP2_SALDI
MHYCSKGNIYTKTITDSDHTPRLSDTSFPPIISHCVFLWTILALWASPPPPPSLSASVVYLSKNNSLSSQTLLTGVAAGEKEVKEWKLTIPLLILSDLSEATTGPFSSGIV